MAIGAGAPYVARWVPGFPYETVHAIEAALRKPGFSFVELLMPCPTGYGKANRLREADENWKWYRENSITHRELRSMTPEERAANEKIVVGTLWEEDRPEYCAKWKEFVATLE